MVEGDGLDKLVDQRMGLIDDVKSIVGDSFDPHGKSEKEMKIEAIKSVDGDSAEIDGKDDVYVNAYFNAVKNRKQSHFVGATVPLTPIRTFTFRASDLVLQTVI